MLLQDFLSEQGIRRKRFAERIGVTPPYITALCKGEAWPSRDVMRRIVAETGGAVGPQDFLDQDTDGEAA